MQEPVTFSSSPLQKPPLGEIGRDNKHEMRFVYRNGARCSLRSFDFDEIQPMAHQLNSRLGSPDSFTN